MPMKRPPRGRRPGRRALAGATVGAPLAAGTTGEVRRRLISAQAGRLERLNALAAGEVLAISEVTSAWEQILLTVRERLLALPASLAATLAAESGPRAVYERLETAVRDCLQALSEWRPPPDPERRPT